MLGGRWTRGRRWTRGWRDSWVGDVDRGDVSHLCGSAEAPSLRPVRREVSHELRPNAVYVSRLTKIRGGCREARLLRPRDDHNDAGSLERVARYVAYVREDALGAGCRSEPTNGPETRAQICEVTVPLNRNNTSFGRLHQNWDCARAWKTEAALDPSPS